MKSSHYLILILFILIDIGVNCEITVKKEYVKKCCPKGIYIAEIDGNTTCVKPMHIHDKELDFNQVPLYNEHRTKTGRNFGSVYNLIDGKVTIENLNTIYYDSISDYNYYMSENGILYKETPNKYVWWTELTRDKFCIDYLLNENATVVLGLRFWVVYIPEFPDVDPEPSILLNIGLFISCFFLALILVVYCLLPGSRVLSELIQMAYVASTLGAFFFLSLISITIHTINACLGLSYVTYFLLLASFCWMVVMSYDLWSLHSNMNFTHRTSKRKMLIRFRWYGLFAWGIPAVMTIFLIIVNHIDLRHIPSFTTPNIPLYACFIEGGEKILYLYIPMLFLILGNWIFFFLTSYNLWQQFRMTSAVDRNTNTRKNHRTLTNRFFMYLKLSIIMGISWILEIVSYLKPNAGFNISDYYNMLIGLSMFLVLVCNKKTYMKLKKRFEPNVNAPNKVSIDTENF